MVIRRKRTKIVENVEEPRGFDAFDLRLGDLMRGERATMGKSLLDVEREIRIRASYIAAIENADPNAFDTPGFIPGYVRSYARYLGMNPDEAFDTFCRECGFSVTHGMSAGASSVRKPDSVAQRAANRKKDPIMEPATPFVPQRESLLSGVEPGAIGSAVVLIGLISAIGFGGWTVLNEVQQVRLAPVENTPNVLTDLDPLDEAVIAQAGDTASGFEPSNFGTSESLDRVYRPEALDVPVIVARDGPIATIDPSEVGTLQPQIAEVEPIDPVEAAIASVLSRSDGVAPAPQVLADAKPPVRLVAVRPAWIRVTSAEGNIVFEGTLNGGETYEVPALEQAPNLRVGESGAVYFQVADAHYGPVGPRGTITRDVALSIDAVTDRYNLADLTQDEDLSTYVAELETGAQ